MLPSQRFRRWFPAMATAVATAAWGLQVLLGLVDVGRPFRFLDWKLSHFLVSYGEYGFIKRGLVGTVLSPLPDSALPWVASALTVLGCGAFFLLLRQAVEKAGLTGPVGTALLGLVTLSPLGAMNLGWDAGRFDVLLLTLTLAALGPLVRGRAGPAFAVTAGATLIHESFLVFCAPLLVGVAVLRRDGRATAGILGIGTLLGALLLVFGNSPEVARELAEHGGSQAWRRGVLQPHRSLGPWEYATFAAYLSLVYGSLVTLWRWKGWGLDLLLAAAFAPLALYAMGLDYARWTSLAFFVSALAFVTRASLEGGDEARSSTPEDVGLAIPLLLLALPLAGPLGVTEPFPLLRAFLHWLGG